MRSPLVWRSPHSPLGRVLVEACPLQVMDAHLQNMQGKPEAGGGSIGVSQRGASARDHCNAAAVGGQKHSLSVHPVCSTPSRACYRRLACKRGGAGLPRRVAYPSGAVPKALRQGSEGVAQDWCAKGHTHVVCDHRMGRSAMAGHVQKKHHCPLHPTPRCAVTAALNVQRMPTKNQRRGVGNGSS